MRRSLLVVVMLVVAAAALIAVATGDGAKQDTAAPADVRAEPESGARAGAEERQEEAEVTSERLEALAPAKARAGSRRPVAATTQPAAGWVGRRLLNPATDDWEPAVAADRDAPYVVPADDPLRRSPRRAPATARPPTSR